MILSTQSFSYDSMGNPTGYHDKTLTWEGKQLTGSAASTSGQTLSYAYDQNGLRTQKTVTPTTNGTAVTTTTNGTAAITATNGTATATATNGTADITATNGIAVTTNYYYNGSVLMGMVTGTGSNATHQLFSYDASGNVVSVEYSSNGGSSFTTYYYLRNAQNDVAKLIDGSGNTVVQYTYDSWGKLIATTGTLASTVGQNQPFRYRGYVIVGRMCSSDNSDTETGWYYLQSRYYDPTVGRFISADSQLNTSIGVLGCNVFAYCLNNPVNMADYNGNKPGDLFDSMDDAARDFANYINAKSIEENREYASYIYRVTVTETRTITYVNPNVFGDSPLSWLWNVIFCGGRTKTVTVRVKVTKYTYRNPKQGTSGSCSPPINWFGIHTIVGRLHTHAAYDPAYSNDIFSTADKRNAERQRVPTYVATPLGTLRKYDPSNGEDIILFDDIPFDQNHPGR